MNLSPLFLARSVQIMDQRTQEMDSISSFELMNRAVERLWTSMRPLLPKVKIPIAFLIGSGNNGGDALGLAKRFHDEGWNVSLFGSSLGKTEEWLAERQCFLQTIQSWEQLPVPWKGIVVDGVFGSGFRGELPDELKRLFKRINGARSRVWSLDVPSGLDGNSLIASEGTLEAEKTFVIGAYQVVHRHPAHRSLVGQLVWVDIGLKDVLTPDLFLVEESWIRSHIPPRKRSDHKGSHGRLHVKGGFGGMPGAGILVCHGAFKAGCGYVSMTTDRPHEMAQALPEVVLKDTGQASAMVVGPGLGLGSQSRNLVREAVASSLPLVIDGDGLSLLGRQELNSLKERPETVLTPHPKELAHLLGVPVREVLSNPYDRLKHLGKHLGVTVLLKGPGTLVWSNDVMTMNPTGNSGMATAGMGDVLSGIIGAFLADGISAGVATRLGVYVHGLAGDQCAAQSGEQGILAHEVALQLPRTMELLR